MIRIRSRLLWVLTAWVPVVWAGEPIQAEDPPGAAAREARPMPPAAAPVKAAPRRPAETLEELLAPLPPFGVRWQAQVPAVVPAGVPAAAAAKHAEAAVRFRVAVPAGVVVRDGEVFAPRRIIVDANGIQRIVPAGFDSWAFRVSGVGDVAEFRRRNMANVLQQRLDAIDAICGLTAQQRERLEFVGRGDIARLFAALAQVKQQVEAAKDDYERIAEIYLANESLRRSVISGPFGEDSLLFKSIEPILDPDQAARFGPLLELFRHPGQFLREENGLLDLQIGGIPFDDKGLAAVAKLQSGKDGRPLQIRRLYLGRTQVTDAGLAGLPGSATLEHLTLSGNAIGDAGLVDLKRFPNLKELNLPGVAITDQTLEGIGELKHLTTLNLSSAQVSNDGVAHLRDLTELTSLTLRGIPISDEAMAHLAKLTSLQSLVISQTNVTDAGIAKLKGLRKLRALSVRGSKVTREGIAELKKSIPHLSTDSDVIRGL